MKTWILLALAALGCAACGTTRSGHYWGETATLPPTKDVLLQSVKDSALDPWTWGPLLGALVFSIDDWDQDVTVWARRETPVFGSRRGADDGSANLRSLARDAWFLSMLATPSGERIEVWGRNKLQGWAVQSVAATATSEITVLLKEALDRERPDSSDRRSFPSGHSSAAFAYSALAWRNVDEIRMPPAARVSIRAALIAFPVGTAWARIEAGKHFPSDVLAGAAVGNFFASLIHNTFLAAHDEVRVNAWADASTGEWMLGLGWSF